MGEGFSKKASDYFKLVALYSFILDIFLGTLIYFCREGLARIFTSDEEIIPMIMNAYSVMILILFIHGIAMV